MLRPVRARSRSSPKPRPSIMATNLRVEYCRGMDSMEYFSSPLRGSQHIHDYDWESNFAIELMTSCCDNFCICCCRNCGITSVCIFLTVNLLRPVLCDHRAVSSSTASCVRVLSGGTLSCLLMIRETPRPLPHHSRNASFRLRCTLSVMLSVTVCLATICSTSQNCSSN